MNSNSIPLPKAIPGKEYIINHVQKNKCHEEQLGRYGFLPGNKIKFLFCSPAKDPAAYEIMGAVLALRLEDSNKIHVTPF